MKPVADYICCPRDHSDLRDVNGGLRCGSGHVYPVVEGVPVLLVEEDDPTGYVADTLRRVRSGTRFSAEPSEGVDSIVQQSIAATSGYLYRRSMGQLDHYPIPGFPFPDEAPGALLDVGAGWCRWTIAAASVGFEPVAVDPSLDLLLAGVRASRQLGIEIGAVAGAATSLPFKQGVFDASYSYSVFQAFDKREARRGFSEMARVTRPGGDVIVQLINGFGARAIMNHALQVLGVRDKGGFRTRYWTPHEMRTTFEETVGPTRLQVDSFFTQARQSDAEMMGLRGRTVLCGATAAATLSNQIPWLRNFADNLFVKASVVGEP